jgi:murein DD-endopeptidase MepM/ murein hydrolase activator NlpD
MANHRHDAHHGQDAPLSDDKPGTVDVSAADHRHFNAKRHHSGQAEQPLPNGFPHKDEVFRKDKGNPPPKNEGAVETAKGKAVGAIKGTTGPTEDPEEWKPYEPSKLSPYVPPADSGPVKCSSPLAQSVEFASEFGVRVDPFLGRPAMHTGLDMRASTGDAVRASLPGQVTNAGWAGGYGRMVEIDHGNGYVTRYGHLSATEVKPGDIVEPGQPIGEVGSTGRSTGPHLHYETRLDGEAIDPRSVADERSACVMQEIHKNNLPATLARGDTVVFKAVSRLEDRAPAQAVPTDKVIANAD